jgi:DNA-binding transcriptional LysR family regulator
MNGTQADYQLLAIFAAVAEETSFSKAARKLGLGKGTVSRAIARLEELLGTELLHRNTHTVALSTAGAALYERTAHHLVALNEAVCKLPELQEKPSGQLRLTAPNDLGVVILPSILAQFSLRYPDIRFDIQLTNRVVDLVAEGFDLALRPAPAKLKDSSLTAAPAYLARRGRPKQLGDDGHDFVMHPAALRFFKLRREQRWRYLCDDFFLVRDLLRDGAGVGYLPSFIAEPYLRDGLLELVPLADRPRVSAALFLVYPSSGQVPRKVRAFRDFLVERFKRQPLA